MRRPRPQSQPFPCHSCALDIGKFLTDSNKSAKERSAQDIQKKPRVLQPVIDYFHPSGLAVILSETMLSTLERVRTKRVRTRVVVVGAGGGGKGTAFPCDVSDLCADQRSRVRGYDTFVPLSFTFHRPQRRSYRSGLVVLFPRYLSRKHETQGILCSSAP